MTASETKKLFESIKTTRSEIARLNNAIEDTNNSIGQLNVMESNGMPRGNRTEAQNDTHSKLERNLDLLINKYAGAVQREQELLLQINELLLCVELEPDVDETLRNYYIRPFFCQESKRFRFHSQRTLSRVLHVESTTIAKRIENAFNLIEKRLENTSFQQISAK